MLTHRTGTGTRDSIGLCWLVACLSACTGQILGQAGPGGGNQGTGVGPSTAPGSGGGSAGSGAGGTGFSPGTNPISCPAGAIVDPGPSTMQLLTQVQYLNTVRDLVGDIPQLSSIFPPVVAPSTFGLVQGDVGQDALDTYQRAAEVIAVAAVGDANTLNKLAPCASGAVPRTCAQTFVKTFGALVYRAPVTDNSDIDRHLGLYDMGATTSYAHGIEVILRGMLQSPRFLYRVEIGTTVTVSANAVKLSDFEVASRLSYSLWDTMPDAQHTAAAAAGGVATKDGLSAQLRRMIQDSRGSEVVRRFLEGWIHLPDLGTLVKDSTAFPGWSASLPSLTGQADSFFDYVLGSQSGNLSALLTSPVVFANQGLSTYYGNAATGSAFQQ